MVGVTETAYENGLAQNVLLATNSAVPGQNEFVVRALKTSRPTTDGRPRRRAPRPDRIGEELEERFPGVDMQVSLAYAQNKYGPFGFALGRPRAGEQCLYAWQRIERGERPIELRGRLGLRPAPALRERPHGNRAPAHRLRLHLRRLQPRRRLEPARRAAAALTDPRRDDAPIYPAPPRGTFDDAFPPRAERARARRGRRARRAPAGAGEIEVPGGERAAAGLPDGARAGARAAPETHRRPP